MGNEPRTFLVIRIGTTPKNAEDVFITEEASVVDAAVRQYGAVLVEREAARMASAFAPPASGEEEVTK